MPTYQYTCKNCGHDLEELQSMTEPPMTTCPACGLETLARIMSSGSGLIFKGSGFYLTDYAKSDGKKPPGTDSDKAEKKSDAPPKAEPTDAKPPPPPPSSDTKES